MTKVYRIYLDEDGDSRNNITLDVIADENDIPKDGVPFCGWWGKIGSTDFLPIVVHSTGQVDTGSDEETNQTERYGTIRIHGAPLNLGRHVYFEMWGETYDFKLTSRADLSEL
ncbi:hypothetical protein [Qipengyuania oceanensis]|uniref:Uncharacterized protein n=1 Tax=Qipengyuania oceanensis TaxID=1463597 RepID=A0A844YAY4_9SPHN|nr:hypothetical protein [Qipengyuania oceanensis]MXO61401.1 hypothetical protein [Qipengyuania oceanensis]